MNNYDYQTLLKRARETLPTITATTERFEMPKVKGHQEGTKTIITNFLQIADALRRDSKHLLKYLQRELATPAVMEDQRLILGSKVSSALINTKIEQYANDFVLCSECKKPDTQILKEDRIFVIKCTACGAKHPVKAKI
jgi:translation initiation factor 2 subunit 2